MASTRHATLLNLLAVVLTAMMVALALLLLDGVARAAVAAGFAVVTVGLATILVKRSERSDS